MIGPYDTPQAFRAALEARLRNVAQQQGTDLQRLQKRVAFERLLARLFAGDDLPWLLKGGYALELRLQDRARSTLDLDLSVPEPKRVAREADPIDAQIHERLQIAAECDLGDGFRFADVLEYCPRRAIMKLVTDLIEVRRLADELNDENWAFRAWIKSNPGLDDDQLMSVVQWLAGDVTAQIDCTTCANCCRVLTPSPDQEDMQRLAQALDMDISSLQQTYLRQEKPGQWELPAPCPLLDGNLCRVYDARPKPCREYPHLHNDFRAHSMARINDTFICPIVFNVVEGMKVEFDWYDNDELDWLDW